MSKWATTDPVLLELYQDTVQHIARYGKRMTVIAEQADINGNTNLCTFARAEADKTVTMLNELEKAVTDDYIAQGSVRLSQSK